MAIVASGAVSFSDLRTEFSGAGAISFSDLYRGGTLVKGNAANNTATNLAASVPTSGTINFTNFRSTAKGWRKTFASGATNQNASITALIIQKKSSLTQASRLAQQAPAMRL